MTKVDTSHHDAHYNAPPVSACFRHLVRKLSSGGASLYDTPRPRLYSSDGHGDSDDSKIQSEEHHTRLRERATQRRKALLEAQAKAHNHVKRQLRNQNVQKAAFALKCSFDRLNPSKWMQKSDHDREQIAKQLEKEFEDAVEQEQYLKLCREASDRCLKAIKDHHQHFLEDHPNGTYEQWIRELHPDNTCSDQKDYATIDHRFYLSDSDHRNIWNKHLGDGVRFHVPVRHLEERTNSDESESSSCA